MARRERMQRKGNHSWMRGNKFLWQQNMQEWNLLKFPAFMEESPGQSRNSSSKKDRSTTHLTVHFSLANILSIRASMSFYKNAL